MRILKKNPERDFTVLNLTDTQLSNAEWEEGHKAREILEYTVRELVARTNPDLITVSGDLAWAGHDHAYTMLADLLDGFSVPWAPVWGNHDNQDGAEYIDGVATRYMTYPNCIYEKGDPALGNGNYIICIEEDGLPCEALFMMDSHNRDPYTDPEGNVGTAWSRLTEEQAVWHREQAALLKEQGYTDGTLILHIPVYGYRTAWNAAFKANLDPKSITPEMAEGTECWNEGYEDSIGVKYEGVGSHPAEDGMLAVFRDAGLVKTIVAGHEHVNNFIINYDGLRLVYSLKTGMGCYWNPILNGGTVLKIDRAGVREVKHEFVDISHLL